MTLSRNDRVAELSPWSLPPSWQCFSTDSWYAQRIQRAPGSVHFVAMPLSPRPRNVSQLRFCALIAVVMFASHENYNPGEVYEFFSVEILHSITVPSST